MNQLENRDIVIGGRRFRDWDDLEDRCFYFPEFEEDVIESGILDSDGSKAFMDTYRIIAELEYGDGNVELPHELCFGWYGETLIEQNC